jgi:lactoylglutathione lyase
MRYVCPLLAVSDLERSKAFYNDMLGLSVVHDLGENVTLTGGISLQSRESWRSFVEGRDVRFRGNDAELYFEEDNIEPFFRRLVAADVELIHPLKEHPWGQRVVRFTDPDGHIIEVGETMEQVCRRFLSEGMSPEQVSARTMFPVSFVKSLM